MFEIKGLSEKIHSIFNAKIEEITRIGNGISGNVFKVCMDAPPYAVAVKVAEDGGLLQKESDYIRFIYERVDIKLPKIYDVNMEENNNYIMMQFFDGMPCSDERVLNASPAVRNEIAVEIADNIAKLQNVKGEKYGELLHPQFTNWHEYYKPFVIKIIQSASELVQQGILWQSVLDTLRLAFTYYDKIFDEAVSQPTLIHGDYWASNIIVDENFHLIGVVDPFNALWADSEYEMFALNAVYGDKLPVLEAFRRKHILSSKFDIKNEFYILFSETYWVTIMKHNNNDYLTEISKRFMNQLQNYKLI